MKKFAFALLVCALSFSSFANADPTNGPQHGSGWIRPDATDRYSILLEPGEVTEFTVQGDGSTDLDCVLRDGNGNVVGYDTDETDYCVISIVPRWRGVFHLYVRNVGSTRAFYRMTAR